jgi:hypothetical protein
MKSREAFRVSSGNSSNFCEISVSPHEIFENLYKCQYTLIEVPVKVEQIQATVDEIQQYPAGASCYLVFLWQRIGVDTAVSDK